MTSEGITFGFDESYSRDRTLDISNMRWRIDDGTVRIGEPELKKGQDELINCPYCGKQLDMIERDYLMDCTLQEELYCLKCEKTFKCFWKAKEWEEVE